MTETIRTKHILPPCSAHDQAAPDDVRRVPRHEPDDTTFAQPAEIAAPSIVPDQKPAEQLHTGSQPWLQVLAPGAAKGRAFNLICPQPEDVDWRMIARVGARIARFGGQTEGNQIFSVAQHEIEGARAILRDTGNRYAAGAFLIHDGHERVVGDIARPVQEALCAHAVLDGGDLWYADIVKRAIKSLKNAVDAAIYPAAGYPWPLDPETASIIKEYDMRMGRTERDARMQLPPAPWEDVYQNAEPVKGADLHQYSPGLIELVWLNMARELLPVFNK